MCGNLADLGVKAPRRPCVGASCEFPLFSQVDGYTPQITCQAHGALTRRRCSAVLICYTVLTRLLIRKSCCQTRVLVRGAMDQTALTNQ